MKKVMSIILSLIFVIPQSGCSLFVSSQQAFQVTTSEADADIFINGIYAGKGSANMRVRRDESVSVLARKEGFKPATDTVNPKMSMVGVLDIIGGAIFLVPFIGLASSGSRELGQSNTVLHMERE